MLNTKKLFSEAFDRLYEMVIGYSNDLKFDKDNLSQVITVSLYGTIIENTSCSIILLKKQHFSGIPILLRNIIESYVDIKNIGLDENYVEYMMAEYMRDKVKILENAKESKGDNPFLIDLYNDQNREASYQEIKDILLNYENDGYKKLNIYERFKRAKALNIYRSFYKVLCQHSHNNLNALQERHIKETINGFQVIYFKEWPVKTYIPHIDTIATTLVSAFMDVSRILDLKNESDIIKAEDALKGIHELTLELLEKAI